MQPIVLTIDILRHGQTDDDTGCLFGASDIALSEDGKAQLLAAASEITNETLTHVVSSPLQRCSWLAKQLQERVTATFEPAFSEMNFGDWEGQKIEHLLQQGHNFHDNISHLSPPNGETYAVFSHRIQKTWHTYVQQHLKQGGHHLLITHGGVIRVILGMILHIPTEQLGTLYIPHATWSRITLVEGERPILWFMNRHA